MEIYKMSCMFYLLCFVGFFFQWSSNRGKKRKRTEKRTLKSPLPLAKFISRNVTLFWNNISILNTFLQVYSKHVCTPCQGILNPRTIQTFLSLGNQETWMFGTYGSLIQSIKQRAFCDMRVDPWANLPFWLRHLSGLIMCGIISPKVLCDKS